jgi:hypothetical protein
VIGGVQVKEISSWLAQGGRVRIRFTVAHRFGVETAERDVRSIDVESGQAQVRFQGSLGFIIKPSEISRVDFLGGSS